MTSTFYRAFEDLHRGSRETIKNRLRVYAPFVEPLLAVYPAAEAIDLGCGRGEWLELLAETGYKARGVDLDEGMLEACHQRGLDAQMGDAIAHLQGLPDQSQTVVSAFHVVEHILFDQLQDLVFQAMRVLKPGGLLIMETPNPENIIVATSNFYVDPSHQRPIPPLLLSFVTEHAGFLRVKTVRLQESKELLSKSNVTLEDVFSGASPDYAVVAQKDAPDQVLELTERAFNSDYGLDLAVMLNRWDARFERLESKAKQAEAKAQQAEAKAQQAEAKAEQAEAKAEQALLGSQNAQSATEKLHAHAQDLARRLQEVQLSYSWRITAPLRWAAAQIGRLGNVMLSSGVKVMIRKMLRKIKHHAERHPALHAWLMRVSRKIGIYQGLRSFNYGLADQPDTTTKVGAGHWTASEQVPLTPSAQKIYDILKCEIENIQKGPH